MKNSIRYKRKDGFCEDKVLCVRQIDSYIQIQTIFFDGCVQNPERKPMKEVIFAQACEFRKKANFFLDKAYRLEAIANSID